VSGKRVDVGDHFIVRARKPRLACRLRADSLIVLAWLAAAACSSAAPPPSSVCHIDGPQQLVPRELERLRLGMPKAQVDQILGPPIDSPTPGQFYYFTSSECPLSGSSQHAPCGVVAEYRVIKYSAEPSIRLTGVLEQCSWGATGE
jgi:hypothetical protein